LVSYNEGKILIEIQNGGLRWIFELNGQEAIRGRRKACNGKAT
jgi:hypothetical protein